MTYEPKRFKFLVIGMNYFGTGMTYKEAKANHRKISCGQKNYLVRMWAGDDLPHTFEIDEWGAYSWCGTKERPILIEDKRRASDKKMFPMEIGDRAD